MIAIANDGFVGFCFDFEFIDNNDNIYSESDIFSMSLVCLLAPWKTIYLPVWEHFSTRS